MSEVFWMVSYVVVLAVQSAAEDLLRKARLGNAGPRPYL